jgi:competence protein ComFC
MNLWLKEFLNCLFPCYCSECGSQQRDTICNNCIEISFKAIPKKTLIIKPKIVAQYLISYDSKIIKKALYQIKYHYKKNLALLIAPLISKNATRTHSKIIIPIPSSKDREIERGFDHVMSLFSDFTTTNSHSLFPCLKRKKTTKALNKLNKKERESLLENIFIQHDDFNCSYLKGKEVLLVDDIITSGTSIKEAASFLEQFEPLSITALSLCHAELKNEKNY